MKRISAIALAVTLNILSPASAEQVLECVDTAGNGFKWDEQGNANRSAFTPTRFTVRVFSDAEGQVEMDMWIESEFLSTPEPGATLREIHWQSEAYYFPYLCKPDVREVFYCSSPFGSLRARSIIFGENSFTRFVLLGSPLGKDTRSWISVYYGTCSTK